jgi:hypothetical protein
MRQLVATLILAAAFSSLSCSGLRVHVGKTAPPDFTFTAGQFAECCTHFYRFFVFDEDAQTPIWEIVAKRTVERSEARALTIHYGKVPDGFEQKVPASGQAPPLIEGKHYEAVAHGSYVPGARVRFMIENDKIVEVPEKRGDNP